MSYHHPQMSYYCYAIRVLLHCSPFYKYNLIELSNIERTLSIYGPGTHKKIDRNRPISQGDCFFGSSCPIWKFPSIKLAKKADLNLLDIHVIIRLGSRISCLQGSQRSLSISTGIFCIQVPRHPRTYPEILRQANPEIQGGTHLNNSGTYII